jgi:para-nitrobenzyl esterase
LGGVLGAPHTLEVPFAFGNVDLVPEITGTGPERLALQSKVMGAWTAFARTGRPDHAGLPKWTSYSTTRRETMILDNDCHIVSDPAGKDRETIFAAPPYGPEAAGRR